MLHALTKQIAAKLRDLIGASEVFVVMHDAEEVMAISRKKLQVVDQGDDKVEVSVNMEPMCFVRLMDIRYDEGRNGYRKALTPFTWVDSFGRYLAMKMMTVGVGYEIRVYSGYGRQAVDLVPLLLEFPRSLKILAVLNDRVEIEVPVSVLLEEIYESGVDFMLGEKGIKMYRIGGRVNTLGYMFPVNVPGVKGEGVFKEIWRDISSIVYKPVDEVDVVWYWDENKISEIMPCLLKR